MNGDYIINPWFIYLLGLVQPLLALCMIAAFTLIMLGMIHHIEGSCSFGAVDKFITEHCGIYITVIAFFALALIFIPNKKTLIQMYVAATVTKQDAIMAKEEIIKVVTEIGRAAGDGHETNR